MSPTDEREELREQAIRGEENIRQRIWAEIRTARYLGKSLPVSYGAERFNELMVPVKAAEIETGLQHASYLAGQ